MNKTITLSLKTFAIILSIMVTTGGALAKAAVWVWGRDIARVEQRIESNAQNDVRQDENIKECKKEVVSLLNDTLDHIAEQSRTNTQMILDRLASIENRLNQMGK